MHPKTKPSSEEKLQLEKAISRRRLTVQKLLNGVSQVITLLIILYSHLLNIKALSTSSFYEGKILGEASPAFMDRRRLQDAVHTSKMKDYPKGMGWEGQFLF